MVQVYLLTAEQAASLVGVEYMPDCYFNPIQDAYNEWIISQEEVAQCSIDWVKELPLIDYFPKEDPNNVYKSIL
jgi:hypothetical protein